MPAASSSSVLALPEQIERVRTFDNGLVIALARGGGQTGGDVWKGAFCLQRFLAANPALVRGKRVCELGAGTGFLSMSIHLLGSARCVRPRRSERSSAPRASSTAPSSDRRATRGSA